MSVSPLAVYCQHMRQHFALTPFELTALPYIKHAFRLGMGDNKNFMSRYIIRVIITIIDIITISLNSATGTKIVKIS